MYKKALGQFSEGFLASLFNGFFVLVSSTPLSPSGARHL